MEVLHKLIALLKARTGLAPDAGTLQLALFILSALVALAVLAKAASALWGKLKPLIHAPAAPALCGCDPLPDLLLPGWLERASLAVDYLRTRRAWRYASPWFLMLGQPGAGKSSLLDSIGAEHRQSLSERQKGLQIDSATWHAIDRGLILDPEGKLPYAAANLAVDAANPDQASAHRWQKLLDQLDALRPERALDGIVLVVSASTFLQRDPALYTAAAQNARQQLRTIEDRLEFALPVYVVVTACDHIEGFGAFWRSQHPQRQFEMVGWSAPSQVADGPPALWGEAIFDEIGQQLRALQVEAAAHCERIAAPDADLLFLYPHQFAQMLAPFQQWLSIVFQVSAWQTTFFLRGVYFTGVVAQPGERVALQDAPRGDVAFVRDLLLKKVLVETHLGRPTRAGVWSRNLLIRRVQWFCIFVFSALVIGCGLRTYQLDQQIERVVSSLKLMQQLQQPGSSGNCIQQEPVYQLIEQVAQIDADAHSWLLPLSMVDSRLSRQSARTVAGNAFKKVVLPGLACQMSQHALDLGNQANSNAGANLDYAQALAQLQQFVGQINTYEQNSSRFQRLLGRTPFAKDRVLLPEFTQLVEYAYRAPLPARIKSSPGLLPVTLDTLNDQDFSSNISTPPQFKQNVGDHILALSGQVKHLMDDELQAGVPLLAQLTEKHQPILSHVQQFTQWLTWIRTSWLGSSANDNPLQTVQKELAASLQPLILNFGYPANVLGQASTQFDATGQYPLAMQTLGRISLPGYGALFVTVNQQVVLNPAMQGELVGLNALSSLDYMQIYPLQNFICQGNLAGWSPSLLKDANQYAVNYGKFLNQPLLKNGRPDALYRQLARYQLELAMNNSLQLAQAAASGNQNNANPSSNEARQSMDSSNFGNLEPTLLSVEKQFSSLGMDGSATQLAQCASQYANDQLGQIALLADQSQLYQPAYLPASSDPDAYFFDLGSTPVITDMLARQVSRVQVLVNYAQPILNYLGQAEPSAPTSSKNTSNATYWNNTASELKNYLQAKDPNAQASLLDNLFLKVLPNLQNSNCNKLLSAYQSPPLGNDLFSGHRQQLEQSVQMRCKGERYAQAQNAYLAVATRFNRELAGRYPFGPLEADDAGLATVQAFFADYDGQRAALDKMVAGLDDPYWNGVRQFLSQLDQVDDFLRGNMVPSGAAGANGDTNALLNVNVNFQALASSATGSNQISQMSLVSGAKWASFPNGNNSMDWQYGQPLVLDLSWAGLSLWRPAISVNVADLQVEGNTASFAAAGNWALLRMIERHQPKSEPASDPHDPTRALLEFDVAVLNSTSPGNPVSDTAHIFLSIKLSNVNAKTGASLKLPTAFPSSAPQ